MFKLSRIKPFLIHVVRCSSFFFTGIKESKWVNVHYEFESAESGRWFTSGDAHLWEFTDRWIYFLGLPIWRLYFNAEDKGIYDTENYT
jgi:hypothetical protein